MKYWLIVFLMTPEGEYAGKYTAPATSKVACEALAVEVKKMYRIDRKLKSEHYCVSDDHYMGRKQDPGVPYD